MLRVQRLLAAGSPDRPDIALIHSIAAEIAGVVGFTQLKAHRLAHGWTVAEAVERFHLMCREDRIKPRGLAARSWLQWEAGDRPNWDYQDLLSRLFRANPVVLGWARDYRPAAASAHDPLGIAEEIRARWPADVTAGLVDLGVDFHLHYPGGATMPGAATAVQVQLAEVTPDNAVHMDVSDGLRVRRLAEIPQRGLLIGVEHRREARRAFAIDAREALRGGQVVLPTAYEFDDLTFGVLWAVANLDEALLFDDFVLAESIPKLSAYEQLDSSSVSKDVAAGLTPISRGWLGSDFCARHILRHLSGFDDASFFWTREQRGEEACTWLLYRHKYDYLRRTSDRYRGGPLGRAFCVPEDVVTVSPVYERILLFLAIALMESMGIRTWLCADPAYSDVEGFALRQGREAVVATWVRTTGLWHVDATDFKPTLRDFDDAVRFAQAKSVIEAAEPHHRLVQLAAYLDLDIAWLAHRCHALSRHGWERLARPHSRLLSLNGLSAACAYVGRLAAPSRLAG